MIHIQYKSFALRKRYPAIDEFADPDFRALQVRHNADFTLVCLGALAHGFGAAHMNFVLVMREVEAHHIYAGLD